MEYMVIAIGLPNMFTCLLTGILGVTNDLTLPFNPFKTAFFIGWFFLCLYSVQRSDNSPLVSDRFRFLSNIAALFLGPLHLLVLFIADTVVKMNEGELEMRDLPSYVFMCLFEKPIRTKATPAQASEIQLMDTSGRSFQDVYSKQVNQKNVDRTIQRRTERIILAGINGRASDILIDPKNESDYTIRFRVDGFLRVFETLDSASCNAVINSLKAVSGMDIAEKRRPQDGAFMARMSSGEVFFRMATSGVLGGEKLAIRVMDQTRTLMSLADVGFSPEQIKTLRKIVSQPQGIILVCGPTGSGKTTSLYAMLKEIDFRQRNVITIEDPIEHIIPDISQIEINTKAGVSFAGSLRSVLRQDPDVICVGEIRDQETATLAIQAAQTGHLVLATLHASSNLGALIRLVDLGVKPLLISSALSVVISQRLVRRLCQSCKSRAELTQDQLEFCEKNKLDVSRILKANGCEKCGGTGYHGRTAILDVMYMNDRLSELLCNEKLTPGELKKNGDRQFDSSLRKEGMKGVLRGITTLDEVKRLTMSIGK